MTGACLQVLLAQCLPAKALEEVMAAVKTFHLASQAVSGAVPQQGVIPQQRQPELQPQLWLQCRLQVPYTLSCLFQTLLGLQYSKHNITCMELLDRLPGTWSRNLQCMHGMSTQC